MLPAAEPRPGTDGDPVVLRVVDEVPDDQEVGVEAHVVDDAELHLHPLDRLGRRRVAVAAVAARPGPARAGTPSPTCRPGSRSAGSAACRARSRRRSARRSRASRRAPPASRRTTSAISSEDFRKNSFVLEASSSAARASTSSARTAAPRGGGSPPCAGSARRPSPTSGRPISAAKRRDRLVDLLLLRQAVALDLEVDLLGPEGLDQLVEVGAGVLEPCPGRSAGCCARPGSR